MRFPRLRTCFPIRSEFVKFSAALRIAQDLVGLVDFLEFFLRRLFVLGDIRMILPRECAEGLLNVFTSRFGWHAKDLVIIFKFNGHGGRTWETSDH